MMRFSTCRIDPQSKPQFAVACGATTGPASEETQKCARENTASKNNMENPAVISDFLIAHLATCTRPTASAAAAADISWKLSVDVIEKICQNQLRKNSCVFAMVYRGLIDHFYSFLSVCLLNRYLLARL